MEENKADFKIKNSVENSNVRPGPSNLNPRSANSNIRLSSSSSHWGERDRYRRLPGKRSHSENDDWGRDIKTNKRETPDRLKSETNSGNENSNENPLMNIQDIALASQRFAAGSMSQQSMSVAVPQQSPQHIIHPQAIPYQTFGYNAAENFIDPSQGAYTLNHFTPIMPLNSQWPGNHALPATASSVASTSGIGIPNGMDMVATTNGNIGPYPYMNIGSSETSLYPMVPNMQMFTPYTVMNNQDAIIPIFNNLEPITINHAVLTPPLPGETRTRRPKPNGCRTVYVGGLPEKISEEIIRDAFKICGAITVVRMSKKNFCHIRFNTMESVDQALFLSGFRIKIDESDDPAFNGRLHVDYAVARDDQHDYECLERARMREERHRQQEAFRPPSPPQIPHFSEHEAQTLAERLRNEETVKEGVQVLVTWLDRGECNKKNCGSFYSLIQSSHSHVKRLRIEKNRYKEEAEKANENLLNKNRAIESEINEIEKVFVAAKTQKVWDHFTRSQRKKMEEMINDTHDLKQTNSEDLVVKREEEEMEMSDTEDRIDNEDRETFQESAAETRILHEKITALTGDLDTANKTLNYERAKLQNEITQLKLELEKKNLETPCNSSTSNKNNLTANVGTQCILSRVDDIGNEQQLTSLVAIFLQVHPFGASIDYICSYLMKMAPTVNARDVESLLRKCPNLFKEVCTGIGATLEKKWTFVGFDFKL